MERSVKMRKVGRNLSRQQSCPPLTFPLHVSLASNIYSLPE